MPLTLPSTGQVNAALRHAGTAAGTAVTIATVMGLLPADDAAKVTDAFQHIAHGLEEAFGGFATVFAVVGPVAMGLFTKSAVAAASLKSQLHAVTSNSDVRIEGRILAPADVANAVPSDKVVPDTRAS